MIAKITILTSFIFAVIYPLCFWISFKDPLKNNFHKFHIGLPNFVGGVTLVFILLTDIPWPLKFTVVFWKAVSLSVSRYFWKKEYPQAHVMTIPVLIGLYAFVHLQAHWMQGGIPAAWTGLLGGLILCAAVFAMNLGHWYLNVHGLPIGHLRRAVYVLWFFLAFRILWDLSFLMMDKVLYQGNVIPLVAFIQELDGFLLAAALFFGTLFPFSALFLVQETLKLKNTQATTGILYVILCSILLGDLTYKYYALKFGIFL